MVDTPSSSSSRREENISGTRNKLRFATRRARSSSSTPTSPNQQRMTSTPKRSKSISSSPTYPPSMPCSPSSPSPPPSPQPKQSTSTGCNGNVNRGGCGGVVDHSNSTHRLFGTTLWPSTHSHSSSSCPSGGEQLMVDPTKRKKKEKDTIASEATHHHRRPSDVGNYFNMERPTMSILLRGVSLPSSSREPMVMGDNLQESCDVATSPSPAIGRLTQMLNHVVVPRRKVSLPPPTSCRNTVAPSRIKPSSIVKYIADAKKEKTTTPKKKNASLHDVHHLRLLHNRYLQWRFVNARAEAVRSLKKVVTEDDLYSVWLSNWKMMGSVAMKNAELQRIRQEVRLELLLGKQVEYLEEWATMERQHSASLMETIEALKGSVVRVPITGRARGDVRSIKRAINSTVDIMEATTSITRVLSTADGANCLVSELAKVVQEEKSMLEECREYLETFALLQAKELSLRAHILQLRQDQLRCDDSSRPVWI